MESTQEVRGRHEEERANRWEKREKRIKNHKEATKTRCRERKVKQCCVMSPTFYLYWIFFSSPVNDNQNDLCQSGLKP